MKHSKSSLFLMELIIALLFFSLASTVCIQLFVKSYTLSQETTDLNYAINSAQNMAEAFIGCNGDLSFIASLFEEYTVSIHESSLSFTEDEYTTLLTISSDDAIPGLLLGEISVVRDPSSFTIYELTVEHYLADWRNP